MMMMINSFFVSCTAAHLGQQCGRCQPVHAHPGIHRHQPRGIFCGDTDTVGTRHEAVVVRCMCVHLRVSVCLLPTHPGIHRHEPRGIFCGDTATVGTMFCVCVCV